MKARSTIYFFIGAVFIIPVTAWALVNWYEKKVQTLPVMGSSKEHRIGNFSFINQDGQVKNNSSWKNKIVVADFFFTHCPIVCPQLTKSLQRVQAAYQDEENILFNSFTVDPERDSAAQLKKYTRQFNINTKNWDLYTGDKKEIYLLARNSFMLVTTDGDGGPTDFIHSENLVLIDQQKKIRGYYSGTSEKEVNQLITDIKKLQHEK